MEDGVAFFSRPHKCPDHNLKLTHLACNIKAASSTPKIKQWAVWAPHLAEISGGPRPTK